MMGVEAPKTCWATQNFKQWTCKTVAFGWLNYLNFFTNALKTANPPDNIIQPSSLWFFLCLCFVRQRIYKNIHNKNLPSSLSCSWRIRPVSVPWSSKWNWSLHLFLGRPMFFLLLVYIVTLVLVFYLCPSSIPFVATFPGIVLFPLFK
jgi:hypothetical protein